MKAESLVIADQHAAVNTFPGLVHTARHTKSLLYLKSPKPTARRQAPTVWPVIGVKS